MVSTLTLNPVVGSSNPARDNHARLFFFLPVLSMVFFPLFFQLFFIANLNFTAISTRPRQSRNYHEASEAVASSLKVLSTDTQPHALTTHLLFHMTAVLPNFGCSWRARSLQLALGRLQPHPLLQASCS